MHTNNRKKGNMFLIIGTFAIIVLMLFIGLIGEVLGGLFSAKETKSQKSKATQKAYAKSRH